MIAPIWCFLMGSSSRNSFSTTGMRNARVFPLPVTAYRVLIGILTNVRQNLPQRQRPYFQERGESLKLGPGSFSQSPLQQWHPVSILPEKVSAHPTLEGPSSSRFRVPFCFAVDLLCTCGESGGCPAPKFFYRWLILSPKNMTLRHLGSWKQGPGGRI